MFIISLQSGGPSSSISQASQFLSNGITYPPSRRIFSILAILIFGNTESTVGPERSEAGEN